MDSKLELSDGSVLIRPFRTSDTEGLYEAVRESIPEVSKWLPWCHVDYSIDETRTWVESRAEDWEKGSEYDFIITSVRDGCILGGCGLNNINYVNRMANLGYWVRTSQTKTGVATAAARLVAKFGFDNLELNRIEILVDVNNKISQRVAKKAGATREGVLRNRVTIHDAVSDAVIFSLIPGDIK